MFQNEGFLDDGGNFLVIDATVPTVPAMSTPHNAMRNFIRLIQYGPFRQWGSQSTKDIAVGSCTTYYDTFG